MKPQITSKANIREGSAKPGSVGQSDLLKSLTLALMLSTCLSQQGNSFSRLKPIEDYFLDPLDIVESRISQYVTGTNAIEFAPPELPLGEGQLWKKLITHDLQNPLPLLL